MNSKETSFEKAINASIVFCNAWESEEISDEVFADKVSELLKSRTGARGFFVVSLSSDCPIMDRLPDVLVMELRAGGKSVVDLTVRNLAMSTAMALVHQRNCDLKQKSKSERIAERCTELLRLLEPSSVKERLEKLLNGINGQGEDLAFLDRWGYDNEQKLAIKSKIKAVAEN